MDFSVLEEQPEHSFVEFRKCLRDEYLASFVFAKLIMYARVVFIFKPDLG